jgi:hypothetical protein
MGSISKEFFVPRRGTRFDENCRVHCAFQRTSVFIASEDATHPAFGFSEAEYCVLACPCQAIREDNQPIPSPVLPAPRPRLRQEPEPRGPCETLGGVFQTGVARERLDRVLRRRES